MQSWLLKFCALVESAHWAVGIRESTWAYPIVQLIHFSGLSFWVGTIALVDLRFLGLVARRQSAGRLARQIMPLTWTGFCVAVTGGFLLFSTTPTTFFYNPAFRIKLPLVLTGVVYHIVVQWKEKQWGASEVIPVQAKVATLVEFLLWVTVVVAAVNIPNYQ